MQPDLMQETELMQKAARLLEPVRGQPAARRICEWLFDWMVRDATVPDILEDPEPPKKKEPASIAERKSAWRGPPPKENKRPQPEATATVRCEHGVHEDAACGQCVRPTLGAALLGIVPVPLPPHSAQVVKGKCSEPDPEVMFNRVADCAARMPPPAATGMRISHQLNVDWQRTMLIPAVKAILESAGGPVRPAEILKQLQRGFGIVIASEKPSISLNGALFRHGNGLDNGANGWWFKGRKAA